MNQIEDNQIKFNKLLNDLSSTISEEKVFSQSFSNIEPAFNNYKRSLIHEQNNIRDAYNNSTKQLSKEISNIYVSLNNMKPVKSSLNQNSSCYDTLKIINSPIPSSISNSDSGFTTPTRNNKGSISSLHSSPSRNISSEITLSAYKIPQLRSKKTLDFPSSATSSPSFAPVNLSKDFDDIANESI
jgi:hypothetical protein